MDLSWSDPKTLTDWIQSQKSALSRGMAGCVLEKILKYLTEKNDIL